MPPGEVFTLGKQAFVFRSLVGPDADDDDVKLTHDNITNQSGPRFPVPRAAMAATLTAGLAGSAVTRRRPDQPNDQGWARERERGRAPIIQLCAGFGQVCHAPDAEQNERRFVLAKLVTSSDRIGVCRAAWPS